MEKMHLKSQLSKIIGDRILKDADTLALFMPDHIGRFPFIWGGKTFEVILKIKDLENETPQD